MSKSDPSTNEPRIIAREDVPCMGREYTTFDSNGITVRARLAVI